MNDYSWFKMYRKILGWEWFKDSKTLHVFIYLLSRANVKSGKFQGLHIKRGQVVTSYAHIAEATGMSVSSARRAIENLVSTGEIVTNPHNKFNLITINKYDSYQFEQAKEQAKEQQVKKNNRRTREIKKEVKKKETKTEYTPKWWEKDIPKQAWGKFPTEEEWFSYAEEHRDEVLSWDMR